MLHVIVICQLEKESYYEDQEQDPFWQVDHSSGRRSRLRLKRGHVQF
jgi:hypothetical protein